MPVRNGGLLPLHACLILGLASEDDYVAKLWRRPLFVWLGGLSYSLYITQIVAGFVANHLEVRTGLGFYKCLPLACAVCTFAGHFAPFRMEQFRRLLEDPDGRNTVFHEANGFPCREFGVRAVSFR